MKGRSESPHGENLRDAAMILAPIKTQQGHPPLMTGFLALEAEAQQKMTG